MGFQKLLLWEETLLFLGLLYGVPLSLKARPWCSIPFLALYLVHGRIQSEGKNTGRNPNGNTVCQNQQTLTTAWHTEDKKLWMLNCKQDICTTVSCSQDSGILKDHNNSKSQRQWRTTRKQTQQDSCTYNLTVSTTGCIHSAQDQARQKSQPIEGSHSQSPTAKTLLAIDGCWRERISSFKDMNPERLAVSREPCIHTHTGSAEWIWWGKPSKTKMKMGENCGGWYWRRIGVEWMWIVSIF